MDIILRENLALAAGGAGPGSPEQARIADLYSQFLKTPSLTANPELIKGIYEATEGFGLVEKQGRLGNLEDLFALGKGEEAMAEKYLRPEAYMRGVKNYFGIGGDKESQGVLLEIRDELKTLNDKFPGGMPAAAVSED